VALLCLVVLPALPVLPADRPAYEITPDGSPVRLEDATFFDQGPMLSLSVRNREAEAAFVTLQVFAFDADGRLKAASRLCLGDPVGGTTRARFHRPLEFRGVTTRDAVVVLVQSVVTERRTWTLAEPLDEQIARARSRANLRGVRLAMRRVRTTGLPDIVCPCDCQTIATACREICGASLGAFTCTPWFPGCTASCTCQPQAAGKEF